MLGIHDRYSVPHVRRGFLVQETVVLIDEASTHRWVCNRGHPHPTRAGALACEEARANGATDEELYVLLDAEVAEFNA